MLAYALGRNLGRTDQQVVAAIVQTTKPEGYRFGDLVIETVNSTPFQTRQARGDAGGVKESL
jgi:hypothetical protein